MEEKTYNNAKTEKSEMQREMKPAINDKKETYYKARRETCKCKKGNL